MAYTIPSDISRMALAGAHSPELETLALLKRRLPNDYTVFHGVHWTREHKSGTRFGEIDFVVVNRSGEVLFIEQKNGALKESAAGLVKSYGDNDKNVADQLNRSIDGVMQKFSWQHGKQSRLKRDYLIYLPDYRVKVANAAGLDASRVVDAGERDRLAERVESVLGPGKDSDRVHHDIVHAFFRQTFEIVADIPAYTETHEKHFVRQVGPAADILANLEMSPYRLRFEGVAGSGKSLMAHQFFSKQAASGKRVLLVCFNRPLAARLRATVPEASSGYINNFHGFCTELLESSGQSLEFPARPDAAFWQALQERVAGEEIPTAWRFDALVVDEGQDFEQEWLEILRLFVPEDADILWLADSDQNLYGRPGIELDGFVTYRCRENYRSPDSIARFIGDTLEIEFEPMNDLPGLGVGVHGYEDEADQKSIVDRIIRERVQQGFGHEDIVIVSLRGYDKSVFFNTGTLAGIPLRRPTHEYHNGEQVFTPGRIGYDSIYRYKGQQSPSVILVDVDPRPDRPKQEQCKLYCGMTRATVRLDIVASSKNTDNLKMFKENGL